MRAVLQRCGQSSVKVGEETVGAISKGWFILLGVGEEDAQSDVDYLVKKIVALRAFSDANDKMNLDIKEYGGDILVVSQFTLYGDCSKGRRPSFQGAALPEKAIALYQAFIEGLKQQGIQVAEGRFAAKMDIYVHGDGPVTLILESKTPK